MDESSRNTDVLLSTLLSHATDDLEAFVAELASIDCQINTARNHARPITINKYGIMRCPSEPLQQSVSAVDSGSLIDQRSGVFLALVAGVRYGANVKTNALRYMAQFEPDQGTVVRVMRMSTELSLLWDVEETTIMDDSFWTLLRNANQALSSMKDGTFASVESERLLNEFCVGHDSLILRTLRNDHIIAMSKSGLSGSISENLGFAPMSDKKLMSVVLYPDEYVSPLQIRHSDTNVNFGVHSQFGNDARREIEKIYKENLMFTFYKPWVFKPAYRVEFHRTKENQLKDILRRIKWDTRHIDIIEPENQFLADRFSKSVSGLAELYRTAAMTHSREVFENYR